jgi:hypothetical protein
MENLPGSLLMAAITLPLSFYIARSCLRCLVRSLVRTKDSSRHVL